MWLRRLAADRYEIRASDGGNSRRAREIYDGLRPAFRRPRKQHDEANETGKNASRSLAETGRHEPRMKAVRCHAGAGKPACEFAGEKNVGKLGAAIGGHNAVVPGELQVGKIERVAHMRP